LAVAETKKKINGRLTWLTIRKGAWGSEKIYTLLFAEFLKPSIFHKFRCVESFFVWTQTRQELAFENTITRRVLVCDRRVAAP